MTHDPVQTVFDYPFIANYALNPVFTQVELYGQAILPRKPN